MVGLEVGRWDHERRGRRGVGVGMAMEEVVGIVEVGGSMPCTRVIGWLKVQMGGEMGSSGERFEVSGSLTFLCPWSSLVFFTFLYAFVFSGFIIHAMSLHHFSESTEAVLVTKCLRAHVLTCSRARSS